MARAYLAGILAVNVSPLLVGNMNRKKKPNDLRGL